RAAATPLFSSLSLHDALPIWGNLGRNIPGRGGQQLFQTGRLVRRRQKAKHRQTPAVGKKIAAQLAQIRARRDAAQAAAIIESAVDRKSTRLNSSHVSISYAVF